MNHAVPYIELALPFPPSTNGLYTNRKGGRAKTPGYKAWQEEAGLRLNRQRVGRIEGPYHLVVDLERPTKKNGEPSKAKRDLDNYVKAISDLIVTHGVVEDDRYLESVRIAWSDHAKGAFVTVQADAELLGALGGVSA